MDYLDFYELNQEPFSNAPVSRFYYDSAQHSQALVRLMFALNAMKGLAILVGDIGAGKTTLARRLLDALDEKEYEAALLVIIHRDNADNAGGVCVVFEGIGHYALGSWISTAGSVDS